MTPDFVIVLQALITGGVFWRMGHESHFWDRAGFAILGATSGLMTIRRITAKLDTYVVADRVVLPQIITFLMMVAVACFMIEMAVRLMKVGGTFRRPAAGRVFRYLVPFTLFALVAAADECISVEPSTKWDGQRLSLLTHEDALNEALTGVNVPAACEQVRWNAARGIDALSIVLHTGKPEDAMVARMKLDALAKRLDRARTAPSAFTAPATETK